MLIEEALKRLHRTHLLNFGNGRPEQLNISLSNWLSVLRKCYGCIGLFRKEHESITGGTTVGLLHEQNPFAVVQNFTRIVAVSKKIQLEERFASEDIKRVVLRQRKKNLQLESMCSRKAIRAFEWSLGHLSIRMFELRSRRHQQQRESLRPMLDTPARNTN